MENSDTMKIEEKTVDDWEDDRAHAYLALREPANDNDERHSPAMAPANDNRRGSWIERDEAGRCIRVVRGKDRTPRCNVAFRAAPGKLPLVGVTAASVARARLDEWRRNNPQTDCRILPRAPRNKGGHALSQYVPELAWWREMTNSPTVWAGMVQDAANDNDPGQEERENEEERPSIGELMRCLPPLARIAVRTVRRKNGWGVPHRKWVWADIEWRRGRIARLGGLCFATATRHVPDEASETSNATGAVLDLPRAGELVRFRPEGRRGWSRPTVHAREHRNGQGDRNASYLFLLQDDPLPPAERRKQHRRTDPAKAAAWLKAQGHKQELVDSAFKSWLRSQDFGSGSACPPGLPHAPARLKHLFMSGRTTPGAGTKDGSGNYDRVRPQAEIDGQHVDGTPELDMLRLFRDAHADHAATLDKAMTAQNLRDIAEAAGASSPHTGRRLLAAACEALRDYRQKYSAGLQFLPSRAA